MITVQQPLVSIIMTSYNHAKYIDAAFESIVNQTYQNWELICLDDGSKDNSLTIIQSWKRKLGDKLLILEHHQHSNKGIAASHLSCLEKANGSVIAYLESDDIWKNTNLSEKIAVLEKHPNIDVVYSKYKPFGVRRGSLYWSIYQFSNRLSLFSKNKAFLFSILLKRNPVASFSHFIVRKQALNQVPVPLQKELFYDWWCLAHLARKSAFYKIPKALVKWRIHPRSANYRKMNIEELRNLYLFIQRLYNSLYIGANFDQLKELAKTHMQIKKTLSLLEKPFYHPEVLGLCLHPLSLIRMWIHIILRKLLID